MSSRSLFELSAGRNNNLNLVRLVAATAVLFSHCFVLSTGLPGSEPMKSQIGMTFGTIAVDVFFVISGFLVTASLARSHSITDFTAARILRIFPGLLVMLLITVFGLGLTLSSLSPLDYLHTKQTYSYLAHCATLVRGVEFRLPGVFEQNPYPFAVNGSLWTLPYEIRMYGILVMTWMDLAAFGQWRQRGFESTCVLFMAGSGIALVYWSVWKGQPTPFLWLFYMFFTGAASFVMRCHIQLSRAVAVTMMFALLLSSQLSRSAFTLLYLIGVAYLTLYQAYVPSGLLRRYNRVGDFSYGIYIYAFPIQQALVALIPGIGPWSLFLLSGIATLAIATLSWKLVEKPCLGMKVPVLEVLSRFTEQMRRVVK